jgi:hypothetical protein
MAILKSNNYKILPNKDPTTCGKERFIRIQKAKAAPPRQIREQQLG